VARQGLPEPAPSEGLISLGPKTRDTGDMRHSHTGPAQAAVLSRHWNTRKHPSAWSCYVNAATARTTPPEKFAILILLSTAPTAITDGQLAG
jgi:hypothetical protein